MIIKKEKVSAENNFYSFKTTKFVKINELNGIAKCSGTCNIHCFTYTTKHHIVFLVNFSLGWFSCDQFHITLSRVVYAIIGVLPGVVTRVTPLGV
jgi:hypothetical protein